MLSESINNRDWNQLVNFITSHEIVDICNEFFQKNDKENKTGFNIFQIISDKYHREDFHSDFLALLLNPKENHGCGNSFLNQFVSMVEKAINVYHGNNSHFAHHYSESEVYREYPTNDGRIDILILSPGNKRAIVVENKINGAPDMPKQLPRYFNYLSNKGFVIDAIVHLSLDGNKSLSREGWSKEDEECVNPVLVRISAYNHSHAINLVDDFLKPSIPLADSIDVIASLRQYTQIIKILNQNNMDKSSMERFYQELQKENNLKIALSIRDMLNNFPMFYAQRIADKFNENNRCSPFPAVYVISSYGGYAYFEKYEINGLILNINVIGSLNGYEVRLECQKTASDTVNKFKRFTDNLNIFNANIERIKKYPEDHLNIYVEFKFEEEQELLHFLDELLEKLRQ